MHTYMITTVILDDSVGLSHKSTCVNRICKQQGQTKVLNLLALL